MSRISATRAALFINLVPVTAVLLGWWLLDERLSAMQWVAAAAVIAGACLSQMRTTADRRATGRTVLQQNDA